MKPSVIFIAFLMTEIGLLTVCALPAQRSSSSLTVYGEKRDALIKPFDFGSHYAHHEAAGARRQLTPYQPPTNLIELLSAILRATRNWFAELILQLLGLTAGELIKEINRVMVGMDLLVNEAVLEILEIIERVPEEIKEELQSIVNEALEESLENMQPIIDQLRQVIPSIPDSRYIEPRDLVSDLIEAILGISLQTLLGNINDVIIGLEVLLSKTLVDLTNVANKVSPEIAAEIEQVIANTLVKAQDLLIPLLNMLGRLPISVKLNFQNVREY